MMIRGKEFWR